MTSPDITVKENSTFNLKNNGVKKQRRQSVKTILKSRSLLDKTDLSIEATLNSIDENPQSQSESYKSSSPPSRSHSLLSSDASSGASTTNLDSNAFPPELTLYYLQLQQQLTAYAMMQGIMNPVPSTISATSPTALSFPTESLMQALLPTLSKSNISNETNVSAKTLQNKSTPPLTDHHNISEDSSLNNSSDANHSGLTIGGHESSIGNVNNRKNYKSLTRERRVEANARERSRVHTISAAFESLRQSIPSYSSNQKLSKLAILRIASRYIESLACLLDLDYSGDQSESFNDCVQRLCDTLNCESRTKRT